MKKVILTLCIMMVVVLSGNANETKESKDLNSKKEVLLTKSSDVSVDSIVLEAYDICTVTVTVTIGGSSATATATNNMGDCDAAAELAEEYARMMLFFMDV